MIFIIIIVIGVCIAKIIQSRNETVSEHFGNNIGTISDYHELEEGVNKDKQAEQIKIALIGGGIILFFLAIMSVFKTKENKIDPYKNLVNLKNSLVITQEEYDKKIQDAKLIEQKNIDDNKKEKELKKLVENLENLKAKGIISDIEFDEKLMIIKNNRL